MLKSFLKILVLLVCAHSLCAQELHYTFTNLNERDGLRNNIIFSMLKDKRGILWVGTQNGLNRFDGSHFYNYKKTRDKNSLPNNTINSLCEDEQGSIWGATSDGIFNYSVSENKFTNYAAPKEALGNNIVYITIDQQQTIYAVSSFAILQFDKAKHQFQLLSLLKADEDSLPKMQVGKNRALYDERSKGLWFGFTTGLYFYDLSTHKLSGHFNHAREELFTERDITALAKSSDGNIWCCDNQQKEVISFDPVTKKTLQRIPLKQDAPAFKGATILEDCQHRLWVSSWSYDLLIIDLKPPYKINKLQSKEGNRNTVASNFFWAALEDENSSIWLGTPNGLSICTPGKYLFKANQLPEKIPEIRETASWLIAENPSDKTWWMVLKNMKVVHYDPLTEKYAIYDLNRSKPSQQGLISPTIYQLIFVDNTTLITTKNGTWQLKPGMKEFVPYDPLSFKHDDFQIKSILEKDSILYMTDGDRLLAWNKRTKQSAWINYSAADSNKNIRLEFNQMRTANNQIVTWLIGNSHIGYLDAHQKIHIVKILEEEKSETAGYFQANDIDSSGNIWIANKGVGLYNYNLTSKKVNSWTEIDGLIDNHLHSIICDNMGYVWCIYFNKVSVFNPHQNTFSNFSIPYSENNLSYFNDLTRRSDGIIMGNVYNDIFEFYPKNLLIKPVQKAPVFGVIYASGKEYFVDNINNLILEPQQNSLRFKFGMLLDAPIYPHEFEYILEGSDKNWVQSSLSNEANYNNLAPGEYTFKVIAKGRNNSWKSLVKSVHIIIKTPFYKTKWFLALALLMIAFAIFYLYRYRLLQKEKLFQLESKAQLLEKEKTMVMYESLKQQLNPHFLFNSLTSLSSLIITDQTMAGEFLEQMSGIYRYILKNGDSETVFIKDEIEFVNLYIKLQQTRFKKGFEVILNIPQAYFHYKIAPVSLQNMIENAMKHNIIDPDSPLVVEIYIEDEYIVVKNNLQKKNKVETSNKKGLEQFKTLYRYLSDTPIYIEETSNYFMIKIPLI